MKSNWPRACSAMFALRSSLRRGNAGCISGRKEDFARHVPMHTVCGPFSTDKARLNSVNRWRLKLPNAGRHHNHGPSPQLTIQCVVHWAAALPREAPTSGESLGAASPQWGVGRGREAPNRSGAHSATF